MILSEGHQSLKERMNEGDRAGVFILAGLPVVAGLKFTS